MADPSSTHPTLDNGGVENDTLDHTDTELRAKELDVPDEVHAADKTIATRDIPDTIPQRPNPISDFVDYLQYLVPNITVARKRIVVYQQSDENLIQRQDINSLGFEWVQRFSWINQTGTAHKYTETVEEGLTTREGVETERNFSVSASFKGLGLSAGGSQKNFSERETSRVVTVSKEINVAANATTYFYQKRYNFQTYVWFWQRVPNWENFNHFYIGSNGTYNRVQRLVQTSIYAEEYATLHRRLDGYTSITAQGVSPLSDDPYTVRQFQNITKKAKDKLKQWDITG